MGRAAAIVLMLGCLGLSLWVFAGKAREGEALAFEWGPSDADVAAAERANADWKLDSAARVLDGVHGYLGSYHGAQEIEWKDEYRLAYVSERRYCLEVRVRDAVFHRWGPGDRTEPGGC